MNRPERPHDTATTFGFRDVDEAERQGLVNDVFSRVADRYDLMNDLMSGGLHRLWKDDLVSWLAPSQGRPYHVLDVAGGTGDISRRIVDVAGPGARATICDISTAMMQAGRRRLEREGSFTKQIAFVAGNAESLPFPDRSFDAVTIAFGIRNVTHMDRALAEMFRVTRLGGRFLCLEFSEVQVPGLDQLYDLWSFNVIPKLGQLAAGDADSYRYLVESIRRFPRQEPFADMIRTAGFERVGYRNLSGGIAALHSGWRL